MFRFGAFAFVCVMSVLGVNCTGINPGTHIGTTNTNPAQEYAMIGVYGRRGLLYHDNVVAGQLGAATPSVSGEACSYSVLWLIAFGDSSIETAKRKGGITKVASIEYRNTAIGGFFFHKFCATVRGET